MISAYLKFSICISSKFSVTRARFDQGSIFFEKPFSKIYLVCGSVWSSFFLAIHLPCRLLTPSLETNQFSPCHACLIQCSEWIQFHLTFQNTLSEQVIKSEKVHFVWIFVLKFYHRENVIVVKVNISWFSRLGNGIWDLG